ncbi:hypothetical protein [Xanthovirga aplysinae]|uniref:hypothetical protein n=1 Tax=Xanthovirga aplysinae TaxID=2529853 RepID=UPI0012BD3B82|nr:hypothetical protein [Xanthovirga aplysinae]MTI30747.1 hypothetical protein [Xanthovirga aplysinae]
MPIANCFIKDNKLNQEKLHELAIEWAKMIQVAVNDICITTTSNFMQGGQQYEVMVNLFLPSLWSQDDIKKIQSSLLGLLVKYLEIKSSEIFIITSIIESGHVIENGEIIDW